MLINFISKTTILEKMQYLNMMKYTKSTSIIHSRVANSRPDKSQPFPKTSQNRNCEKIFGCASKQDLLPVATYSINFIKILLQNDMEDENIYIAKYVAKFCTVGQQPELVCRLHATVVQQQQRQII